jgi:tRNA1(Val) A37 N6-methylase TrmN6
LIYQYDSKKLNLLDIEGVSRPSEDPIWLVKNFVNQTHIKQNDTILDMGCGIGVISLMLTHRFPQSHIHGMDIQKKLIQASKLNAQQNNLKNCTFEYVDILKSDFMETYNHVISNPPYHRTEKGFIAQKSTKNIAHGSTLEDMLLWIEKGLTLTADSGTFTFIQHVSNLDNIKPLLKPYTHTIEEILTSTTKPPKKLIVHIQK